MSIAVVRIRRFCSCNRCDINFKFYSGFTKMSKICFLNNFIRPNDGNVMEKLTIDARETAPSFATQDMYVNNSRKSSIVGKIF